MNTKNSTEFVQKLPPPYLIVGLGKSGNAARRLLQKLGVAPHALFTFDDKIHADFSSPLVAMQTAKPKTLIVSPGYSLSTAWLQEAKKNGVIITSELSLASFCLTTEKLIGVTGSVGKSTVCALLGAGFTGLGEDALVCGNFGFPLADYAADLLEKKYVPKKWLVIELSSYQLENCKGLRLHTGVLVSLTPNHLERYPTQSHYYATKISLFNLTVHHKVCGTGSAGLFVFLNELASNLHKDVLSDCGVTDPHSTLSHCILAERFELLSSTFDNLLPQGKYFFDRDQTERLYLTQVSQQKLIGQHNVTNILLCMAVFRLLNFTDQADMHLLEYSGLPHRLENLGEHQSILFINDSKATTLESVMTAATTLHSSYPKRRAWLLVGGKDKNLPWQDLNELTANHNLKFLFFGECGEKAKHLSRLDGDVFQNLPTCLEHLKQNLQPQDVVLFSPGGTSLDEFKSFEDRGVFFKNWVLKNFSGAEAGTGRV